MSLGSGNAAVSGASAPACATRRKWPETSAPPKRRICSTARRRLLPETAPFTTRVYGVLPFWRGGVALVQAPVEQVDGLVEAADGVGLVGVGQFTRARLGHRLRAGVEQHRYDQHQQATSEEVSFEHRRGVWLKVRASVRPFQGRKSKRRGVKEAPGHFDSSSPRFKRRP